MKMESMAIDQSSSGALVSLSVWSRQMGVTAITVWRWQKKGMLKVTNIHGRLYLSQAAIAEFNGRAQRGEFAKEPKVPKRGSA